MFFNRKITDEDIYNFLYVLSRYTGFGLRLNDAVNLFAEKVEKPELKELMKSIQKDLTGGTRFSDAIAKHKDVIPSFVIENIRVGETTSQMGPILENLVFHMDQEIRVNKDIESALLPQKIFLFLLGVAAIIILFLVIPKMGELLRTTEVELPWFTYLVVRIGDFFSTFWWLFLILGIFGVFAVRSFKKNNPEKWDAFTLSIPFFADLNFNRLQYRFSLIFGLCLQAGIDTRRALEYTSNAVDNLILKNTLQNAVRLMTQRGFSLQEALSRANEETKILHNDFQLMLSLGATGSLDEIMLAESKKYQQNMIRLSKQVGDKVGVSIAIPGYIIMLILFAAIELPIFSMIGNLSDAGM